MKSPSSPSAKSTPVKQVKFHSKSEYFFISSRKSEFSVTFYFKRFRNEILSIVWVYFVHLETFFFITTSFVIQHNIYNCSNSLFRSALMAEIYCSLVPYLGIPPFGQILPNQINHRDHNHRNPPPLAL